jgi:hypothetical protein
VGHGDDVGESFMLEEGFDGRLIDCAEGLEEGFSKLFLGLGDGSFIVHSLKISSFHNSTAEEPHVKSAEKMYTSTSNRIGSFISLFIDSINEFLGI